MPDKAYWEYRIRTAAKEFGVDGYGLIYGPWERLEAPKAIFLSLNPGRPPHKDKPSSVEDPRGNSYEVEKETTKSPITDQFLRLCKLLGLTPSDVLAGVVSPFRSMKWHTDGDSPRKARECSVGLGREFWTQALLYAKAPLIITSSLPTKHIVSQIFNLVEPVEIHPSGWAQVRLTRYRVGETDIINLPHLSRYKLLNRHECAQHLRAIFGSHIKKG